MTEPITLLIADNHPVFRRGLTDVLDCDASLQVVGEAADGATALELVRRRRPRVAVLGIDMPSVSGLAVAEALRREGLDTDVVIVATQRDAATCRRALDLGVKGFVLKDSAVDDIVACLRLVAAGGTYVSAALTGDSAAGPSHGRSGSA